MPVPPLFNGRLERWYDSDGSCRAKKLLGWSHVRFGACLLDPKMLFFGVPPELVLPFKLSLDGQTVLLYQNITCEGSSTNDTVTYDEFCTPLQTRADDWVCTVTYLLICPFP